MTNDKLYLRPNYLLLGFPKVPDHTPYDIATIIVFDAS
jgi:hypothetical protein